MWWLMLCQLNGAMGVPRYLVKRSGGVSVRVLLDDINSCISGLDEADCSPWWGWPLANQLKTWIEHKGWPFAELEELLLLDCVSWHNGLFLPLDLNWSINSSGVSSLLAMGLELTSLALLALQFSLLNCMSPFLSIYVYMLLVLFL